MHAVQTLATQFVPAPQLPQLCVPPHPFGTVPQVRPAHATALAVGVQQVPALQVGALEGHVPQEPQPFGAAPQVRPPQLGVQATHAPAVQVVPAGQVPQLTFVPQPVGALPHTCAPHASAFVFGVQQRPATQG